jgi:hypothetical protein
MWAALWEPLLLLKTASNGRVRRVLGTAGWVWGLAEWVYDTGYSHSEREREKHDSLTIKVRDGGRKNRAVGLQQHNDQPRKSLNQSRDLKGDECHVGFPYCYTQFH